MRRDYVSLPGLSKASALYFEIGLLKKRAERLSKLATSTMNHIHSSPFFGRLGEDRTLELAFVKWSDCSSCHPDPAGPLQLHHRAPSIPPPVLAGAVSCVSTATNSDDAQLNLCSCQPAPGAQVGRAPHAHEGFASHRNTQRLQTLKPALNFWLVAKLRKRSNREKNLQSTLTFSCFCELMWSAWARILVEPQLNLLMFYSICLLSRLALFVFRFKSNEYFPHLSRQNIFIFFLKLTCF